MKIVKDHFLKIESLAESGEYTYQDICNAFDNQYTLNQIKYHINKHCPNKNIKKEYSRGGSKLESILKQLFPYDTIIKEYPLPNRLRVDFVLTDPYFLAFEFDGAQHANYSNHFHGSKLSFNESKARDLLKEEYLKERGINLIRLASLDITAEQLLALITSVGYGSGILKEGLSLSRKEKLNQSKKQTQQRVKERREAYQKSQPYISRMEELKEKQKKIRKDQYKKVKEWKKQMKKK